MTQLGELVHIGMTSLLEEDCPFCKEAEGTPKAKVEMVDHTSEDVRDPDIADDGEYLLRNDSGELANGLGAAPSWQIQLKLSAVNDPPFVDSKYFVSRISTASGHFLTSKVCANAHHLVPGNASLGRATSLLKWMADDITWKRVRYKATPSDLSPHARKTLRHGGSVSTFAQDEEGNMNVVQRVETSAGRIRETNEKRISGRVTGKIDYDVNSPANGVWLPSNNAVVGWSKLSTAVQTSYVEAAINSTAVGGQVRQFHDAHEAYSNEILKQLNELATEIESTAKACIANESHKGKKEEPLPAPTKLISSMNSISGRLRKKLVGSRSSWGTPFLTSQRSK